MKRRLLAMGTLVVALGLPFGSVQAETITPSDVKSIQAVVQSHLTALAEDDAVRAFAAATSETREQLGSAENFLQLIKDEYRPIYLNRHVDVTLSAPRIIGNQTIQVARVTDASNHVWVALFRMERDADKSWKIAGCELIETPSIAI